MYFCERFEMFVRLQSNLKLEDLLLWSIRLPYYRWRIPERIERLPDIYVLG
jgi:hypothetical protein